MAALIAVSRVSMEKFYWPAIAKLMGKYQKGCHRKLGQLSWGHMSRTTCTVQASKITFIRASYSIAQAYFMTVLKTAY